MRLKQQGTIPTTNFISRQVVGVGAAFLLLAANIATCAVDVEHNENALLDVPPVVSGNWYRPSPLVTWYWQSKGPLRSDSGAEIYSVEIHEVTVANVTELKSAGYRLICHAAMEFSKNDTLVRAFESATKQLNAAVEKGCDGIAIDVGMHDSHDEAPAYGVSGAIVLNKYIANAAHRLGLSAVLVRASDQVLMLVDYFDAVIADRCHSQNECDAYAPFAEAAKPILNVEYVDSNTAQAAQLLAIAICPVAVSENTRTLVLPRERDGRFKVNCY